jgi:hypothetical protein
MRRRVIVDLKALLDIKTRFLGGGGGIVIFSFHFNISVYDAVLSDYSVLLAEIF